MRRVTRVLLSFVGLGLVLFGLACLNYTKESTLEHHERWALEHGLPAPGPGVTAVGVGGFGVGVGLLGFGLFGGRARSRRDQS